MPVKCSKSRFHRRLSILYATVLILQLVLSTTTISTEARAETSRPDPAIVRAFRDEQLAYSIGLQAYIYGYPAMDYAHVMREQTTPKMDRHGVYAPINQLFSQSDLAAPGGLYAGRAPNNDTLYFTGWLDLRGGPLVIDAPDTQDRYYALTYADFYSEVQHTGRRTTGTQAQKILVVGPEWAGESPTGMNVVRLKTELGYLLGRVQVDGPGDVRVAKALVGKFSIKPLRRTADASGPAVKPLELPTEADLTSIEFFRYLNQFLRENPRLPGEDALMAQMDLIGVGPRVVFDASALSTAARRGLERAVVDGRRLLSEARYAAPSRGWSALRQMYGAYGFNYLNRAIVEYNGLLGNLPEESIYPSINLDTAGNMLSGKKSYRLVFSPGSMPPVDAFWSLSAYDVSTVDLIPNAINRYSIGDRTSGLKFKPDGSLEIRIQKDKPNEADVNWLPVGEGMFFLTLRMYQPKTQVFSDEYHLPPLDELP